MPADPAPLSLPPPPPAPAGSRCLWQTLHFWMVMVSAALGIAIEAHWIPLEGRWHTIAIVGAGVLGVLGYGAGTKYLPPNVVAQLEQLRQILARNGGGNT